MSVLVYINWRSWKSSNIFKPRAQQEPILKSTASRPRGPRFCPRQNEAPPHHEVMTHAAGTTCLNCILALKNINKKLWTCFVMKQSDKRDKWNPTSSSDITLECLIYCCPSRWSEIFVQLAHLQAHKGRHTHTKTIGDAWSTLSEVSIDTIFTIWFKSTQTKIFKIRSVSSKTENIFTSFTPTQLLDL